LGLTFLPLQGGCDEITTQIYSQIKIDEAVPQEILDNMHVTADDFEAALNEVEPSAMREVLVEVSEVSWADVGGLTKPGRRSSRL